MNKYKKYETDILKLIQILKQMPYAKQSMLSTLMNRKPRYIRMLIKIVNEQFINNEIDYYITGTKLGNHLTKDETEIRAFNKNRKHHALSELYMSYQTDKRITLNQNMNFTDYVNGFYK